MTTRSKTAVGEDLRVYATKQRAIARGLEADGKQEEAAHYLAAADHYEDKARLTTLTAEQPAVALGEVWKPTDTMRHPDQVSLDASANRQELVLDPALDVAAMAMDAVASIEARDSLERMLAHQLALAHKVAFNSATRAAKQSDPAIAIKWANLSAKMMDTFQRGLLTIQKVRSGGTQTVTVHTMQHIAVQGGQTLVTGSMQTGGSPKISGEPK
jgi:hypothetical protein